MDVGAALRRLGLAGSGHDARHAMRWVLVVLGLYVVSMLLFYPIASVNDDESQYLRQARLMLEGSPTIQVEDAFTGEIREHWPSTYSPGTAMLMMPFVATFGWRGAYVIPLAGMIAAVLFTALWLRSEGRSPLYALLVLAFVPALVMGRVAMSDVPSTGIVALGLYLFWRGQLPDRQGHGWWLAAGFVAGASLTFRPTNPLCFVPLFFGTVVRREWRCWSLVLGGLAGLTLRPLTTAWFFGDALFERSRYAFAPETLFDRLPLYLFGLLVLVPGGLLFALLYKGRRRPEIVGTAVLFFCFYVFQEFAASLSSLPKRIVGTLRYMMPLVPVLAFAMSESVPRVVGRWLDGMDAARREGMERRLGRIAVTALVLLAVAAAGLHPAFHWFASTQASIRDGIARHVPNDAVVVTNQSATRKFLPVLDRRFATVRTKGLDPADVVRLAERHDEIYVVLLDKSDSEHWRMDMERNAKLLASLSLPRDLLLDEQTSPTDRLRIWKFHDAATDNGHHAVP